MNKPHGIIVFGANGSGKTTLGRKLARILNFKHIDIEDYCFEESEIPYTKPRSREEFINLMLADIEKYRSFVLTTVIGDLGDIIPQFYELAVYMSAPHDLRMERVKQRSYEQYGERILQGGDMYEQELKFFDFVASRDLSKIDQWAETIKCPIIHVDGTADISDNINAIIKQLCPMLPDDLETILKDYRCTKNLVGRSSSSVYHYQNNKNAFFLKIDRSKELIREHDIMVWLDGKLPVPKAKYFGEKDGLVYLLMTEMDGHMSCDCPEDIICEPYENTVKLLADGILMLQSVDIANCPFKNTLDIKLKDALFYIEHDLVDMDDFEDGNDFDTPMELYEYLIKNKPHEENCFCHGDYCLPNIFINDTKVTGFIDLGRSGIADKWQDIALCVRSLGYNLRNASDKQKHINLLFERLKIEPDWDKINYYILLDELF